MFTASPNALVKRSPDISPKEELSAIALRIDAFQPREVAHDENNVGLVDAFVSCRDLTQLITKCIDAEHLQFAIFNGLSNNRFKRLDISDARELLGYEPEDDFAEENPDLAETGVAEDVRAHSKADLKGIRHSQRHHLRHGIANGTLRSTERAEGRI